MLDRALEYPRPGGLLVSLLLFLAVPIQAQVNVSIEAQTGAADGSAINLETGMSVHTGDAIRFTLRNTTDAYVYLIVIGSSGTARVLQPLSGKPADAWMAAGEVRHIPGDGEFLPMDKQPGPERVAALSATAPVSNLSRLLVRLEDAAPDVESLRRVLGEGGVVAQVLAFNHLQAPAVPGSNQRAVAKGSGLQTDAATVTKKPVAKADSDPADAVVLSGLGSRISAFQADQPLPKQLGAEPTQQIEQIQPFQSETDVSNTGGNNNNTDQENEKAGLGSSLASWFGFGDKAGAKPQQQAKSAVEPAATYPLQAEVKTPTPRVLPKSAEASTPVLNAIPEPVPANGKTVKQVVLVAPVAVEKTLQEATPAPPALAADASAASKDTSAEPEISENGRTAGLLASLFGPSTAVKEQQVPAEVPEQPVLEQQPEQEQQTDADTLEQPVPEQPPELGQQEQQPQNISRPLDEPQAEVDQETASSAPGALPESSADNTVTRVSADGKNVDSDGQVEDSVEKEAGDGGQVEDSVEKEADNGLFGWLSGGNTNVQAKPEVTVASEQSAAAAAVKEAPANDPSMPEVDRADEKQDGSQDSGLFGWLFAPKPDKSELPTATQDVNSGESVATDVKEETVEEQQPTNANSSGIFAGLGALFGGGPKAKNQTPQPQEKTELSAAPKPLELVPPAVVVKSESTPAMTRRKNEQGVNVTVLSGPKSIPEAGKSDPEKGNAQVLSAQGSRISALLDPKPEGEPERAAVPEPATELVHETTDATTAAVAPVVVSPAADNAQQVAQVDGSSAKEAAPQMPAGGGVEQQGAALNATTKQDVEVVSPLVLNQQESAQNVTQLTLNTAPVQAVKKAAGVVADIDLSDDTGLAGAVVLVISAYGSGAGVVINDSGQVLTNWHLVRGLDSVAIAYKQEGEARISISDLRSARVLKHDKFPDLALLAVQDPKSVTPVHMVAKKSGQALLKRGKRLHTLSLSENGAWRPTVAAIRRVRAGSSWYSEQRILHRATVIRADLEGDSAMSGVPLFDENGAMQGLTTLVKADKNKLIAVSSQTLKEFLAKAK